MFWFRSKFFFFDNDQRNPMNIDWKEDRKMLKKRFSMKWWFIKGEMNSIDKNVQKWIELKIWFFFYMNNDHHDQKRKFMGV
jgi:hypothetical protein